jgi:hypothetical protein
MLVTTYQTSWCPKPKSTQYERNELILWVLFIVLRVSIILKSELVQIDVGYEVLRGGFEEYHLLGYNAL